MVQSFGIISENVIVGYLRYALGKSIMIIVGICSIVLNNMHNANTLFFQIKSIELNVDTSLMHQIIRRRNHG